MKNSNWTVSGGLIYTDELIQFNNMLRTFYSSNFNFIKTVFDGSYGLAWNGGRIQLPNRFYSIDTMKEKIHSLNLEGIGFNFTFSQVNLTEDMLEDKPCNELLKFLNSNNMNGVIYANDMLGKYIKENFSNIKLTYSAHNTLKTAEEYKKALENNDLVVLNPDLNHNLDFLKTLYNKDKIEIIVNEPCFHNCPFKKDHIKRISEYNLNHANKINFFDTPLDGYDLCIARANGYNNDRYELNNIPSKDIISYEKLGFKWFKLIGREFPWDRLKGDLRAYIEEQWIRNIIKRYEY